MDSLKTQRRLLVIIGIFASLFSAQVWAEDSPDEGKLQGTIPAHWRVAWTSDPAHDATISWSTAKQAKSYLVRFRQKLMPENFATVAAEAGKYIGGEHELYYYHARLTDLLPSTAYEIQIDSDGNLSPWLYFVTGPDDDRPINLFSGGDSRTDHDERRRANQMLAALVSESYSNQDLSDDIIALAHGGDFVATGTNLSQWSQWLSDYELTMCSDGRLLPIIPTRGNHDKGKIFNQVFGFEDDHKNYYALNIGPQVRLITLNTEIATAGVQAKWLGRELKDSRPKNRWLFAQYHRPAFPAVKAPGTALQSWVPLFEKHNLDFACELDGHTIKRTVPIRGNVKDETGVVYIGEGGLGVEQRSPKPQRWYLQQPGMADSASHVYLLSFDTEKMTGKCIKLKGGIADEFSLIPRKLKEVPGADAAGE